MRDTIAAALLVWLIGAVVGWCAGWVARGEQNRAWHRSVVRQLAQARDETRAAHWNAARPVIVPAPAVVHVTVAAAVPSWAAHHHPALLTTAPVLDALPAVEVQS